MSAIDSESELHAVEDTEEDDMDDGSEDDDVDEDMLDEGDEDDDVLVTVARYLNEPLDMLSLLPCFADEADLREVLVQACDVMRRIRGTTTEASMQYRSIRFRLQQGFALAQVSTRPRRPDGDWLRKFLRELRATLALREAWPKEALTPDPRSGTLLEGLDHFIFEHETEGLIHLKWVNLFAPPELLTEGLLCDICGQPHLQAGFQVIAEDNSRDCSSFIQDRMGFDVCARCADSELKGRRGKIRKEIDSVPLGTQRRLLMRCSVAGGYAPPEFRMSIGSCSSSSSGVPSLELALRGTGGLYLSAAALPVLEGAKQDGEQVGASACTFPDCWLRTGREPPTIEREGARSNGCTMEVVEFKCADGESWLVRAQEGVSGSLLVSRASIEEPPTLTKALILECGSQDATTATVQALPCLRFHGTSLRATLPRGEETEQLLESLRWLASSAGVMTNIPRRQEVTPEGDSSAIVNAPLEGDSALLENATSGYFHPPFAQERKCMICLHPMSDGAWLRGPALLTSCGHAFHAMCVRKHCRGHQDGQCLTCPICRAQDPLEGARYLDNGVSEVRQLLEIDAFGQPLQVGQCYHIAAVLCQDLQAVVDTSLVIECATVRLGDSLPCTLDEARVR